MRRAATSSLEHLIPVEWQKFFVVLGSPRERVNPIKTQDVIDPKKMKPAPNAADTLAPPIEVPIAHPIPMKNRNTPILSPFLSELVVFKMGFRRRATAPVERKFIRPGENVGTVIIDTERNVAHQRNAAPFGVGFDRRPLFVRDPLDVTKEIFTIVKLLFLFRRLPIQPSARGLDVLMFRRPFIPGFAFAVLFHQRAKECVISQPC